MTTDIRSLALQLRAWSEPIASGYEVPAAARTLHAAADAIEALAGERNTAIANLKGLQQQVRDLVAEPDRLKAVLKPRLNAKAVEGLQEILEAMEAMDEREAPFLKTLLDWHEASRKALGGDA